MKGPKSKTGNRKVPDHITYLAGDLENLNAQLDQCLRELFPEGSGPDLGLVELGGVLPASAKIELIRHEHTRRAAMQALAPMSARHIEAVNDLMDEVEYALRRVTDLVVSLSAPPLREKPLSEYRAKREARSQSGAIMNVGAYCVQVTESLEKINEELALAITPRSANED